MVNVVYAVVRVVQFLIFLASFGLVYLIYKEKNTAKQKILLVTAISAILNMYGYLEALSTLSEQSSKWAVRSQYVSALMFMVLMLHLLQLLCDFSVSRIQSMILWSINGVFAILLLIDEGLQILFRNYTFEENLLAVQIRFDFSAIGYIYMIYLALLAAGILYVGTVIRQSKGKEAIITVIAFSAVMPCLGYVLNLAGLTGGFDLAPTLMVVSCWIVYRANKHYHLLDDGQIARETILDELSEGYIILDSERNVKSYNAIAAMLYPELERPKEQEVMIELIYLHNHDVIEHNGKICNVVVSELKENGDLTGYVMWLYDCTDEYYYMRDLEQVKERARNLDKTRNLILNHMTRGFGSPLYIIQDRSQAIYEDERSSEDVREMTLEVFEEAQKLQDMVAVMMDYSGGSTGSMEKETEYTVEELAQSLRETMLERKQGRCHSAQLTINPQLPNGWYGSETAIEQVMVGIFRCAGISSRVSGMRLELDSEMRYADTLLILTLYLDDNGVMTGEFNRLSALEQKPADEQEQEATYIPYEQCRQILARMNAGLECSVDGTWSRICLKFPQKAVDRTPFGEQERAADTAEELGGSQKQFTVMVVDDNLIYLKEMDGWLRKLGLKTVMAKSGAECLRILKRKEVDLIFMDQLMPNMEGTQVLEEIRKREAADEKQPVPVILLTTDDSIGARKRYLACGFEGYLAKPIEEREIREQVRRYCDIG